MVETGMRSHVLRRNLVHRGTHAVEVTSSGHSIMTVVTSSSSSVSHTIVSLSLDLRLNALSVRSVSDHRKDRSDRLDELSTLSGFSVVQSGLYDVVGEAGTIESGESEFTVSR